MGNGNSSNNRQGRARAHVEVRPPPRPTVEVRPGRQSARPQQGQGQRIINSQPRYQPPPRNVPTQTVSANKKYEILVHINKQSISASPSSHHPGRIYINFQYDAKEECTITLYYFGMEVLDRSYSTQYIWADVKKYPAPIGFKLPAGLKQKFPKKKCYIDTASYPEDLLLHSDKRIYPLIIEIVTLTQKPFQHADSMSETTYVIFSKKEAGDLKLKTSKQKIHRNGRSYELDIVYGYDKEQSSTAALEEHSECVICMTDKPDTAIIPCRHLCLCANCAGMMRNEKCPICRGGNLYTEIKKLVRINFGDNNTAT